MIDIIGKVIGGIFSIGDKLIEDKDAKIEYAYKTQQLTFGLLEKLVAAQTVPWVDALVKLITASVVLGRPLGSFACTCIGIYCHVKYPGQLPDAVNYTLDGAFAAWMTARQYDKHKNNKIEELSDIGWD